MPELLPFEPEHLEQIDLRPFDKQVIMGSPGAMEIMQFQALSGLAYTGFDKNGKIIMIGGVTIVRQSVGGGWVLTSELLVKYKVWAHRTIRDILDASLKIHSLHRIEGLILEDHKISCKWAERLGFQSEGFLRKYDSLGNNYYMYSRVT
jgi:RimJ/RimL family protein N-acetyltransferase